MPIALLLIAALLLVAGIRGTHQCLFALMREDASGKFVYWLAAIVLLGSLGYIKRLESVSVALMVLVVASLFLANKGLFDNLTTALGSSGISGLSNYLPQSPSATTATPPANAPATNSYLPTLAPIQTPLGPL